MGSVSTRDWERIHREATIVDLHVHPSLQQQLFRRNLNWRYVIDPTIRGNPLNVRASFPRLRDGGVDAILSAIYVPERGFLDDFPPLRWLRFVEPKLWDKFFSAPPFDVTLRMLDELEEAVGQTTPSARAEVAHAPAELDEIVSRPEEKRPIAVIHSVEGAHSLVGDDPSEGAILRSLDTLGDRGVAMLTLAHFYPNPVAPPSYPFPENVVKLAASSELWRDPTLGLTAIGRRVVERMLERGMLIDITHCTPAARREIYDLVDASGRATPLIASHVGVYELNPNPYNLRDWEIRRIARDGGVAGVLFMPYFLMPKECGLALNFVARTIEHLVDVGGEDVAGIGTDFDGFTTPPDDLDNASLLWRLTQRLVADGHDENRIKKILGGNALRALRDGWTMRSPPRPLSVPAGVLSS